MEEISPDTTAQIAEIFAPNEHVFYTSDKISLAEVGASTEQFLQESSYHVRRFSNEKVCVVQYKSSNNLLTTIGLSKPVNCFFFHTSVGISVGIAKGVWGENPIDTMKDTSADGLVSMSLPKDIGKHLTVFFLSTAARLSDIEKIPAGNRYTEKLTDRQKIYFYYNTLPNEVLLAKLGISSVKPRSTHTSVYASNLKWEFWMTTDRVLLIAWSGDAEKKHEIDVSGFAVAVRSEIGRNTVVVSDFELLTQLTNAGLYKEIEHTESMSAFDRKREFARIMKLKNEKKYAKTIFTLLDQLATDTDNPFDELTLLTVELSGKKMLDTETPNTGDERLAEALSKILHYDKASDKLLRWESNWLIKDSDSIAILKALLTQARTTAEYLNLLPFHESLRERFRNTHKDNLPQCLFDIEYARHLQNAQKKEISITVLQQAITRLPDETMSDLLPAPDTDPTGKASGKFLRAIIFDLLAQAGYAAHDPEIDLQLALAQPLVPERVSILTKHPDDSVAGRATKILQIIEGNYLFSTAFDGTIPIRSRRIDKNIETRMQHPAARQSDYLDNLQHWLAKADLPKFDELKTFSELLVPTTYDSLHNMVQRTAYLFGFEHLDAFIVRGEKSTGIISVADKQPYILIGNEHISPDGKLLLQAAEMQFILAAEIAHLYYGHSRLTSSDVWQGAIEKGMSFLDSLALLLPGIGLLGVGLKKIRYFNRIAAVIQKADKVAEVATAGKLIFETAAQSLALYKKDDDSTADMPDRQRELLLTSRIMQLTADRAGLLLSGNIKASVSAIIRTSPYYSSRYEAIKEQGLIKFLTTRDAKERYIYQTLSIRVASLFSFYLSHEYIALRKEIVEL